MQCKTVILFQKSEKHFKYLNIECLLNTRRIRNETMVVICCEKRMSNKSFLHILQHI